MSAPSNSKRPQGLRKTAWLHFKCLLPSDWEPVAFSSHPKEGRLEFANRDGHLARVAWLQCKETPDIAKMMDEFHKVRLKERDKEALKAFSGLSFRQAGGFRFGIHKPGSPCQAAIYHQDIKTLTIYTFPSFDEGLFKSLWLPILESYSENAGDFRDWALWGLDFRLPQDFGAIEVSPMPANVSMAFESPRKIRVDMHRWGLPDILLQGRTLEEFYVRFLKAWKCKSLEVSCSSNGPFERVEVSFEKRGEFDMDCLYGRWWTGKAICWHDKESMRICAFEQVSSRKTPKLELADVLPQLK